MTGEPVFRVSTAYTLSQYREYNRTVQKVFGRMRLRMATSLLLFVAMGVLMAYLMGNPVPVAIFLICGLYCQWRTRKGLEAAELAQYQQEQLVGTVTYEFHEDRIDVITHDCSSSNPLETVLVVLHNPRAFYIMFGDKSGMILPAEDCSPELEAFIRHLLPVREVRWT